MSSPSNTPDRFLRRAHRRARFGLLVWSLSLAALACALSLASTLVRFPSLDMGHWAWVIPATPTLLSLSLLAAWLVRSRRFSPQDLARNLDAEWSLSARLESSTELAADRSALASAQRADAARHLDAHPAPGAAGWFSGLALLALAALLLFAEGSILGFRLLRPAPAVTQPAALAPDISASIVWKNPESEIKATAIEEIPLAALVTARTGLRSLSLEVSVNGESRLSRPLDAAALATLAKPGAHPVELDLYLDEVGAQEFDLVSYYLRAERSTATPAPVVASPLQFIQIRPPREDVTRVKGGNGPSNVDKLAILLGNLKAAQLQLLKQNFLLAHAPVDHAQPVWREENTRVAADQKLLSQKTTEARDYAISEAMPALVVDNLGQCVPLMESAAVQISASANEPAAKPQGQALGLIVAAEKLIRKIIVEGGSGKSEPKPANHDPFKDRQQFKLPQRAGTPAGQLEQLAQDQADAAQQLNDPSAKKDPLADQAALAARLAALAAAHSLDSSAQAKTDQAAKDAAEAARQLQLGDREAALAPATAAAQALREATAAQEAAGRTAAQAELEKIRRELNAAEHLADPSARAAALAEAAAKLRAEAAAQQQTGSAEAARQLAAAAAKTDKAASGQGGKPSPSPEPGQGSSPSPGPGEGAGKTPGEGQGKGEGKGEGQGSSPGSGTGSSAADAATAAQAALTPRDQALARAARQLSRAKSSGRGDGTGDSPGGYGRGTGDPVDIGPEIELGAQLAAQLLADPVARKLAAEVRDQSRTLANTIVPPDLRGSAEKLIVLLEAARQAGQRDEQVRRFNPDDLDPAYRDAVESYFEKLSRDATKR